MEPAEAEPQAVKIPGFNGDVLRAPLRIRGWGCIFNNTALGAATANALDLLHITTHLIGNSSCRT